MIAESNVLQALVGLVDKIRTAATLLLGSPIHHPVPLDIRQMSESNSETRKSPSGEWPNPRSFKHGPSYERVNCSQANLSNKSSNG